MAIQTTKVGVILIRHTGGDPSNKFRSAVKCQSVIPVKDPLTDLH